MTRIFLKAKHWQLFLIQFGIPLAAYMLFIIAIISSTTSDSPLNLDTIFFLIFPTVLFLSVGILFGWFWSVGMGLQSQLPEGVTMKTGRFKIFYFTPLIYIALLVVFLLSPAFRGGMISPTVLFIIVPLHLFCIFCMFYNLYFVAKTLKTVELQRKVRSDEYIGEFFLIWFFAIGVWFLQPKVNKLWSNE